MYSTAGELFDFICCLPIQCDKLKLVIAQTYRFELIGGFQAYVQAFVCDTSDKNILFL